MNRICYQTSVSSGSPLPLTQEKWDELIDSPKVENICQQIAGLNPDAPDYNERKQALKKQLPIIIPHARAFLNGKRVSADAQPSGLAMLDVDHVADPVAWFEALDRMVLIDNRICLVSITASGHGLRIIGERNTLPFRAEDCLWPSESRKSGLGLESIEAAQLRMATALGISEYDAVTKDLARASYVVPRDYLLWMDQTILLELTDEQYEALNSEASKQRSVNAEGTQRPEDSTRAESALNAEGLTYRGIPYSDIVAQLLIATGNGGGAEQGERNTVYFALANYMRYICDFNPALLLQVLPDFGLSEQERLQAIHSAIGRPRKSQLPLVLQSAITVCEREREASQDPSSLPFWAEDCQWSSESRKSGIGSLPLPPLPKLMRLLCKRLPEEFQPAMLIASLPVLGTLATAIRFEYLDRQEQSLSFFSCITAPAASGKSFIRKPVDLLLTPINEQDAIEREKEQAYKEKLRASKNNKNQPEDPHACPRNNGVAISIAKLLQLLTYAEGKHLIGIGEEMDTLVKSERAGVWSQKSDIYRLAFDNAEYGQAYMSDASFNAHIKVYYNLLLTGTPNSMKRFFRDLENGLATRVCFAQLPDTSFTEIPIFAPYTEREKTEIIRWARVLYAEKGWIECPQVGTIISDWLERKRQQAIDADSHAMDTLRRRAAVIGFRAGMLCYLLENRKYTKTVGAFAEWVAEYVFRNQMELWGEQMEQLIAGAVDAQTERGAATSLLSLLPEEFTTADLIKLRARKGQSVSSNSIKVLLSRWKKHGRIEKVSDGHWKRLK